MAIGNGRTHRENGRRNSRFGNDYGGNRRSRRNGRGKDKQEGNKPTFVLPVSSVSGVPSHLEIGVWESMRDGVHYSWQPAYRNGEILRRSFQVDELLEFPAVIHSAALLFGDDPSVELDDRLREELQRLASTLDDAFRLTT